MRVFMVCTVMGAPSMVRVTVLWFATANPPATVSVARKAPVTPRSIGERASCSLFRTFKASIPCLSGPRWPRAAAAVTA
ncbi:Uncharacterised protein [Mycobacteroides abscessus subsp. abscessus]|nr:Uncharacterised protein [Mycobacteroides abscessus subsp. abscessus]